ncbi:MAG: hypothetical protein OXC14_10805 [Rhodospirillaceae bacterium]|nr:hypothetical protein [Rhodospirillaceae bacterium]
MKNRHWLDLIMGLYEACNHDAENVVPCDEAGNATEGTAIHGRAL